MRKSLLSLLLLLSLRFAAFDTQAAGLTIVTHGFNGTTTGWVTNMAKAAGNYFGPNTDFSVYRLKFVESAEPNTYHPVITDFAGSIPTNSVNCEIVVLLDWGNVSGGVFTGVPVSTAPVAAATMEFLSAPGNFPHLGDRTPLELPIHLIGHSRGGSLVCELSRLMGEAGLWVDQVTTLDPHPLNNGFDDSFVSTIVDPDAVIFENVLFADNYYQRNNSILGSDPSGKALAGAYNRYLTNLTGMGYSGIAQRHANVHLWYHGTIDRQTPTTDGEAFLEFDERAAWYTDLESINLGNQFLRGAKAGYAFSRPVGFNRNDDTVPAPTLSNQISDGLHASFKVNGTANRVGLFINEGHWPNLTYLFSQTNTFAAGAEFSAIFSYQYAQATNQHLHVEFFLDADKNPYNGLGSAVSDYTLPATTRGNFGAYQITVAANPTNTFIGTNYLCAVVMANDNVRYLYQETPLTVTASRLPPEMEIMREANGIVHLGVQGYPQQEIIVEVSTDLALWIPIGTNTIETTTVEFTDTQAPLSTQRFYRAKLATP